MTNLVQYLEQFTADKQQGSNLGNSIYNIMLQLNWGGRLYLGTYKFDFYCDMNVQ